MGQGADGAGDDELEAGIGELPLVTPGTGVSGVEGTPVWTEIVEMLVPVMVETVV